MSYAQDSQNPYQSFGMDVVANASVDERAQFITRTYLHLAGAIAAFLALEAVFFTFLPVEQILGTFLAGRWSWLIVLGAFIGVSYIADYWARSSTSVGMQYLGLSVYVVAQAIIFVPLLYMAQVIDGSIIPIAGLVTLVLFGGMTITVFMTRKDFSFLGSILRFAGFVALGLILCSIVFQGFTLGIVFTVAMIAFACGYILYDTSNVMHHYRTDQHVAASLALFAAVALLFWYVIQLVMALTSRD